MFKTWELIIINGIIFVIPLVILIIFIVRYITKKRLGGISLNASRNEYLSNAGDSLKTVCRISGSFENNDDISHEEKFTSFTTGETSKKTDISLHKMYINNSNIIKHSNEVKSSSNYQKEYSRCCCLCGSDFCQFIYSTSLLLNLIFVCACSILFFIIPEELIEWITGYYIYNVAIAIRPFSLFICAISVVFLIYWIYIEIILMKGVHTSKNMIDVVFKRCRVKNKSDFNEISNEKKMLKYTFERHLYIDLLSLTFIFAYVSIVILIIYFMFNEALNGNNITIGSILFLLLLSIITIFLIIIKSFHTFHFEMDHSLAMQKKCKKF